MTAQLQDTDQDAFEAEKALEQEYFDKSKQAYDDHLNDIVSSNVSGNVHERSSQRAALLDRRTLDPSEAVATARMDLEDGETIYLGSVAIRDENYDLLVAPWQSKIGEIFYEATHDDPRGLARKRVFTTTYNRIASFNDVIFQELSDDISSGTFVGEQDPLLEDLGRGRDEFMRDIVRTITAAQNRIIRAPKDQLLVIQGGPGTGKTAVALHRVSWILYNHREELQPKDVLVVGPNPTFTKYIKRVLPTLGDVDVIQQSLAQLLAGDFAPRGIDVPDVARKKGSAKMESIVQSALNGRARVPADGLEVRRTDTALTVSVVKEDIERLLAGITPGLYNRRRAQFRAALQTFVAGRVDAGRRDAVPLLDRASLDEQSERVYPSLSPQQFVRELYGSKDRLLRAGATESEVDLLYRPAAAKIGDEPWTMADLGVIDCAADAISGTLSRYGHIVVDEAQDLSYMQLRAVRRRSQNGSMTVVGDIAQATSAYSRKDWNQVLTTLGTEDNFTEAELTIGYRVPAPVLAVAARVLATAAPGLTAPQAFPRQIEEEPRWHVVSTDELMNSVVSSVKEYSSRGLFVGVVVAERQMISVRTAFRAAGIKYSESADGGLSQGINLVSPEESKGLEFDAVVVVEPASILELPQGDKLLYVALTRTVHHLDVVLRADGVPAMLADFVAPRGTEASDAEAHSTGGENDANSVEAEPREKETHAASKGPATSSESETPSSDDSHHVHEASSAVTPSDGELKPMLERMAQSIAQEFFEVLREVGPNVQQRVVDILWDKMEASGSDS
ncbi:HelD family protein [Pseudarthrobacter enclensis]|uniref:DNA helicase IV n=1 Tax=Pseudarthrobacter enclensis TaxID=993070 RepID=A0ABT9RUG8_9MICC|nr:AAA family ATPase [Pseudarthrobacter enclensis]MDP9888293.1 DNA helicase IV [Pseudarthrobacter enclensis]